MTGGKAEAFCPRCQKTRPVVEGSPNTGGAEQCLCGWLYARGETATKPAASPKPPLAEKQLQRQIVELAKLRGWLVFHPYEMRRSTPGYPDLTLLRPGKGVGRGRLIYAEVKSERGRLREDQKTWLSALATCGDSVEVFVWRPSDFDEIERTLR